MHRNGLIREVIKKQTRRKKKEHRTQAEKDLWISQNVPILSINKIQTDNEASVPPGGEETKPLREIGML